MDKVIETAIRTYHERTVQAFACETDIAICRGALKGKYLKIPSANICICGTMENIISSKILIRETIYS